MNRIFFAENLIRVFVFSLLWLGLLGAPWAARAQRPAPPDSLRLSRRAQRLGEVRVRAVRPARFAVGSRRLVFDSTELSLLRGGTVAEALQARTPLYIKNYGPGQLATISVRGTGAQHTAVLWNGLSIMLPTLGQNDFALLPLGAGTQLAVQPGPAAALYGSGAIGGAVLLSTAADWRPGLRGSVQGDGGSFGLRGGSLAATGATGAVAVRLAASYRQARNDYPYLSPELGGAVRRRLAGAALRHQWSLAPEVAWRVGRQGELTASAWLTDTDRDIQPGVGASGTGARERDQSRRLVLAYRRVGRTGGQWSGRGAWFEDIIDYQDQTLISNSRVRTTQAQADYTAPLGVRGSLRLGAEVQNFAALVDGYVGGGTVAENRAAAFALLRYDPRPGLRLSANLRQAVLPGAAPLTPTLAAEWDLLAASPDTSRYAAAPQLTLKASAARSFRAPTLNERYWVSGNPDLRPEAGLGYEAGLLHRWPLRPTTTLQSELTAYQQLVDDWVQWIPGAVGGWKPRNLRQVLTRGLEASTRLTLRRGPHRWQARAAYSLTQARTSQPTVLDPVPAGQPLPYVPTHAAALSSDYAWRGWQLGVAATYTSFRYTDASAGPFLPGYGLLNASAGYTLPLPGRARALLLLQATNLLSHSYYSYDARPASPRAATLSLRLEWR